MSDLHLNRPTAT